MFVFSINLVALGVRNIVAISPQQICIGGGAGQVILLNTNHKDTAPVMKTENFGSMNGLSCSPDGT